MIRKPTLVKHPRLKVLRHAAYRAMPWRNGKGITLEIARDPPVGATFAWRVSLAGIEHGGPFSPYPGYRRALVLVSGKDLRLRFRGHGHCELSAARRAVRFEGEWHTECAVPQGRCADLSLIVQRGSGRTPACIVRAPSILSIVSTRELTFPATLYGAVFVLDGSLAAQEHPNGRTHRAGPQDTILVQPGVARTLRLESRGPLPAKIAVLRWRPGRTGDPGPSRNP